MDDRQRVVLKTFSRSDLEKMNLDDLVKLVGEAGEGATFHGTAIIRGPDGKIKYDEGAIPGDYHETPAELAEIQGR